ncbi:hypothetical protein [Frankia sp. R43]|uniref:hypothetical protein n=1 Tax=Frankia sp. R43 TaxID=269536 RepID=UPI00128F7E1C|nr:hypothetical protein [Frankia sp. R43]
MSSGEIMIVKKTWSVLALAGGISAAAILSASPARADISIAVDPAPANLVAPVVAVGDGQESVGEVEPRVLDAGQGLAIPSGLNLSILSTGSITIGIGAPVTAETIVGGPTSTFGAASSAQGGSTGSFDGDGTQGGSSQTTRPVEEGVTIDISTPRNLGGKETTGSFGKGGAQGGSTGSFGKGGSTGSNHAAVDGFAPTGSAADTSISQLLQDLLEFSAIVHWLGF